jgi:hypothetical protein
MMQTISASRRTDIPAFYSDWFVHRLRAGSVCVLQPYSGRPSTVSLKPEEVGAIVFWSKNYAPLLPKLDEIEQTTKNLFFHFTITANEDLELHVPDYRTAIRDYRYLSVRFSPEQVIWRYDPICITDKLSQEIVEERFIRCAELLRGHTKQCIISFMHPYKKALANLRKYTDHTLIDLSLDQKRNYADQLAIRAETYGIQLFACSNDGLLSDKVKKARCIDGGALSEIWGTPLDTRLASTRKECACTRAVDVGAYDTCAHGCLYCYANSDKDRARSAYLRHDPTGNSLRGHVDDASSECPREQYVLFS